jgi:hypothetical protein
MTGKRCIDERLGFEPLVVGKLCRRGIQMAHPRASSGGKMDPSSAYAWTFKNARCRSKQRASASQLAIRLRYSGTYRPLWRLVPVDRPGVVGDQRPVGDSCAPCNLI